MNNAHLLQHPKPSIHKGKQGNKQHTQDIAEAPHNVLIMSPVPKGNHNTIKDIANDKAKGEAAQLGTLKTRLQLFELFSNLASFSHIFTCSIHIRPQLDSMQHQVLQGVMGRS